MNLISLLLLICNLKSLTPAQCKMCYMNKKINMIINVLHQNLHSEYDASDCIIIVKKKQKKNARPLDLASLNLPVI